ncbi:MAG TPA: pirin family protein [Stellaceae bacterium]|nr:pirin family protein [Stellaceae bacterium]
MERKVDRIDHPVELGASDQVQRKRLVLHSDDFASLSPFLRLSEDWFAAPGGFETHPHRGMQTVTLVLDGALHHRDHTGADGVLRQGDVQWMTAGRGVLHSEMPYQREPAHTLQLWLNLPAKAKMIPAHYVNQPAASVPARRDNGVERRIYAGDVDGVAQPHGSEWPMMLIDIAMEPGAICRQLIPAGYRGFLYVLDGNVRLGVDGRALAAPDVAWFEPRREAAAAESDAISIVADEKFRALLYAGPPIDEPVVAYGPFVMNTVEEIRQAFGDYQTGRLVG